MRAGLEDRGEWWRGGEELNEGCAAGNLDREGEIWSFSLAVVAIQDI